MDGWGEVFKVALTTGLIATILNQAVTWVRESRKDARSANQAARYLALRLVVILERFVAECARRVADSGRFETAEGTLGRLHLLLAQIDEYPTDADWRSLAPDLAERALTLRNDHAWTAHRIEDRITMEGANAVEASSIHDEEAAMLALQAWSLAVDLRTRYRFSQLSFVDFALQPLRVAKARNEERLARAVKAAVARP